MHRTRLETPAADGLILAPIADGGAWGALRELRSAMQRLTGGDRARATFITAMTGEGRMVSGRSPEAHLLILGYRTDHA